MIALVDTNILVYRFDYRDSSKQQRAQELLRQGVGDGSVAIPYQALVEFVAATTRATPAKKAFLSMEEARDEVDLLMAQFTILFPTENTVRTALRGAALYKLSWFDALIWAYADERGLSTLWSEDFQHGRLYGRVKVVNPFLLSVHEPAVPYGDSPKRPKARPQHKPQRKLEGIR